MTYAAFLLIVRFVLHVATVIMIIQFNTSETKYRMGAAITAALIAASSAALAMQVVVKWDVLIAAEPMPWLIILLGAYLWKLIKSKGNVAKMFPYYKRKLNGENQ